jgi:CubicO group peptidase (beta-lactamase class C family)
MTDSDQHLDTVRGFAAPGFDGVTEAFTAARAMDERGGASLVVVQDGRTVVDLSVGSGANDATPRDSATTQVMFSCTKGVVATALLVLIERGQLELDAPVARYWPAFAERGKTDLLVRHIVSHMSGQSAFRAPVTPEELADDLFVEDVIASDAPWWEPGSALAYQSLTYGPLCGGLVRGITGESVGTFVRREIAEPLGLDLWIGLPESHEANVAPLRPVPAAEQDETADHPAALAQRDNPRVLFRDGADVWNTRSYHAAEIPGAGGITSAAALARLYGCLALGGTLDGVTVLRPDTVELGRTVVALETDIFADVPRAFGVGFMLPCSSVLLGSDPLAFGHSGYGGQASGAYPSARLGYAYLTTALRGGDASDARTTTILDALDAAVA